MNDLPLTYPYSRKIMKAIIQLGVKPQMGVATSRVADYLHVKTAVIEDHLGYLVDQGFVDFEKTKSLTEPNYVTLNQLGYRFFETRNDRTRQFFYKSILVPFLVSVVTTAVIHWLF